MKFEEKLSYLCQFYNKGYAGMRRQITFLINGHPQANRFIYAQIVQFLHDKNVISFDTKENLINLCSKHQENQDKNENIKILLVNLLYEKIKDL